MPSPLATKLRNPKKEDRMTSRIEYQISGTHRRAVIGALAAGTVLLSVAMAARAQQGPSYSVLYTFTGGTDGANPYRQGHPLLDKEGNLYGTTSAGGDLSACFGSGCGVVFKVDPAGNETVLYTFTGGADGGQSFAGLIRDEEGNLYGTTVGGGAAGVVFRLDPTGKETVLWGFSGGADGNTPYAGVVRDKEGNLYGTTIGGGASGAGVVFTLDPTDKETVLHSFTGGADGSAPTAGLVRDKEGNLYGTASAGGDLSCSSGFGSGCGVVFKLDPAGKETVLYTFTAGPDGESPSADLVRDKEGNLYGTAAVGGNCFFCGTVFKLDPTGKFTLLHSFTGGADGLSPVAPLIRDKKGNLYGTTFFGGDLSCGCGVVFKLDPTGNETVLYTFTGAADGGNPWGLAQDKEGNLYGTTYIGGDLSGCGGLGCGVVFKLTLCDSGDRRNNEGCDEDHEGNDSR
jgi:uncharacterized repeat protein (TIGR03803 family)